VTRAIGALAWHAGAGLASGLLLLLVLLVAAPSEVTIDAGREARAIGSAHLAGVHEVEPARGRSSRWTTGRARLEWPALLGFVPVRARVVLGSYPGRGGDQVAVIANGWTTTRHTLHGNPDWQTLELAVPAGPGPVTLEIHSLAHKPADDPRELGVRLVSISLVNASWIDRLRAASPWQTWGVVVLGLLAWLGGTFAGGGGGREVAGQDDSPLHGAAAVSVVAVGGIVWQAWRLQAEAALVPVAALGVALAVFGILRRGGAVGRAVAALAAGASAAICMATMLLGVRYFVDVPRWDVWETVGLIDLAYDGTLQWKQWWIAQNEHRPFTARVVIAASVYFAQWNHWHEQVAVFTVAGGQLLLLAWYVARRQQGTLRVPALVLPVVSLLVFSMAQWENWLRGFHVHILIGAVAPLAALLVLTEGRQTASRLAAASALGCLGLLSFGTGLLVWPVGAVAIVARRGAAWQWRLGAWLCVAVVATALYFHGMPANPHQVPFADVLLSPRGLARLAAGTLLALTVPVWYAPTSFTGPVTMRDAILLVPALVGLVAFVGLVWLRWREDTLDEGAWLFPASLALFGLSAVALAALGRTPMGMYAMLASRYVAFSACFWIGLVLLLVMRTSGPRRRPRAVVSGAALLAIAGGAAAAWPVSLPLMEADAQAGHRARAALIRGDIGEAAPILYPDPPKLEQMRQILYDRRLSVFRPGAR
jgi:hypothetical protein